jgi:hypothetical protein
MSIVSLGALLFAANPHSKEWGEMAAGMRSPGVNNPNVPSLQIRLLNGFLQREPKMALILLRS